MFELRFGYPTDEDPTNAGYYIQVIGFVPRTSYIGAGIEENGDLCLVAVMADGWDKESQNIHSAKRSLLRLPKAPCLWSCRHCRLS